MSSLLSINYLWWLLASALFFAGGEFLSKKFALDPKWSFVVLLLLAYLISELAWLPAILQRNSLSVVGTLWSVLSLLVTVGLGVLVFGERVSLTAGLGMLTAIVAIVLLSVG